jgi:hypothetical protein
MFGIIVGGVVWKYDTKEEAMAEATKCVAKYGADVMVFRIIGTCEVASKWVSAEDKQSQRE